MTLYVEVKVEMVVHDKKQNQTNKQTQNKTK